MFNPEQDTKEGLFQKMYKAFQPDFHDDNLDVKGGSWGRKRIIITGEQMMKVLKTPPVTSKYSDTSEFCCEFWLWAGWRFYPYILGLPVAPGVLEFKKRLKRFWV